MEIGGVYDDSLCWVPNSSPSFHGSAATMNFEDDTNNTERHIQFFKTNTDSTKPEKLTDDEEYDECFHHHQPAGKKRRLMPEQVQFLEKSFDVDNKLEPERKTQLAKQLGLQPRQVAIWFQNRRARSKTKVLEKEYASLKSSYDRLKADYDTLFKDNESLKNEVHLLTEKVVMRDHKLRESIIPLDSIPKKQESAKSDVFDSESPNYALESAADYSSRVFEFEGSDFSQDEDDDSVIRNGFVPKIEAEECCDELQPNSGNLGFLVQHQGTWLWQY